MNLLENYIRGYLLKEQINSADHQLIEETMEELDRNLQSMTPSMSLDNLTFSPSIIAALRDYKPLKDMGDRRTKPASLQRKRPSQSLGGFNMTNSAGFDMPGLGFNPLERLKSDKPYYIQKIQELIEVYENEDATLWASVIEVLKKCLNLKKAIDQTGLKVLGAGLYRIVVTIPGLDEIVVKIGLGDKGRDDCRKEIDFSDGGGASRLEHQKNFPKIYTRSENKNWYAIEKAIFFSDKMFSDDSNQATKQQILTDLEEQFSNTMDFLESVLDGFKLKEINFQADSKWKLFQVYLYAIFKKDNTYEKEHEKLTSNRSANKKNNPNTIAQLTDKTRINLDKFDTSVDSNTEKSKALESVIRKIVESNSPESIISKNIFKKKLKSFMKSITLSIFFNQDFIDKKINLQDVDDQIRNDHLNDANIELMLSELGSMFDQAVVTNIRDLHTGNMGFKKNDQDKWQLIFTDIDSK